MKKHLEKRQGNIFIIAIFGILALVSLVIAGYFFYQNQQLIKGQNEPVSSTSGSFLTEKTSSPDSDLSDWKSYSNDKYNFEIKFPKTWDAGENRPEDKTRLYLMFDNKPLTSEMKATFYYEGRYDGLMIFAKKGELHPAKNLESPTPDPGVNLDGRIWNKTRTEKITFAGTSAVKTTQEAPFQFDEFDHGNRGSTTIVFNHEGAGWTISYLNDDFNGTHDPTYDQILSTFKFIPPKKVEWKTYRNDLFKFTVDYPATWVTKTQLMAGNPNQGFVNFGDPDKTDGLVTIAWGGGFGGGPCLGQHQKVETKAGTIDMCKIVTEDGTENLSRANDSQGETYRDKFDQAFMFGISLMLPGHSDTSLKILQSFNWL